MSEDPSRALLSTRVHEIRDLLSDHQAALNARSIVPLVSLVEQSRARVLGHQSEAPEVVRSIHHFACSGGTLISRMIGIQPNTCLLSEIDPLSLHGIHSNRPRFRPTDLLFHLRHSPREVPEELLADMFLASLDKLLGHLRAQGQRLVLRDHAHSAFCHDEAPRAQAALREVLIRRYQSRSVVTVRHPIDSFNSLRRSDWVHFRPDTLEEYARRYHAFLDAHEGLKTFKYEDFVRSPVLELKAICHALDVPFGGYLPEMTALFPLTGDSGRQGIQITERPRRKMSSDILREADHSSSYKLLCERLGYNSDPTIPPNSVG